MIDNLRKQIGQKLKDAREYTGYSQDDVAKYLKISRSAVSLIENGQRKLDSVELYNLSKLYKRPMAYFTEDDFAIEQDPALSAFARNLKELSDNDKDELSKFAEFLLMRARTNDTE